MPGKVLLADDSLNIQRMVTQALKDAGIEVASFSNGEHAVRKLTHVNPDLILADVFMPVRTGFEVCAYVKSNEEFAHIPVLLLASNLEPFDEKEARRVGADGRLTKPFTDTAALVATVKQWLEKAEKAKLAPPPVVAQPAAAAPAQPEPQPEPAFEDFTTRPSAVTFEKHDAPRGFADMLEEAPPPPPPPKPTFSPETETIISGARFVRSEPPESPVEELPPSALVPDSQPPPAPASEALPKWPAPPAPSELPEEAPPAEAIPRKSQYKVETPELASPWEMTGPPPGAPEIPAPEWDSQWKGVTEAEAMPPPPPPPEPAELTPAAELASALAAAEQAAAEAVAAQQAGSAVDPALIESVVGEVMKRLSPQVVEQITREIVRPLAEALLKQKLDQ